jgi:dihydroorotate dehydrogenase electron transfer subunit
MGCLAPPELDEYEISKGSGMIDTIALVEENERIESESGRRYGRLRVRFSPSGREQVTILPGQFAMIRPRSLQEPLLRRAMAFYRVGKGPDGPLWTEFLYQILGRGTQALARLRAGDEIDLLGSLGNTFDTTSVRGREAILVGGGAGSPALFLLAGALLDEGIGVRLFLGGASRGDLCGYPDFVHLLGEERIHCATDDGTWGDRGFVTAPLQSYLERRPRETPPPVVYACGPDPMLHRVASIVAQLDVPAQLSLEAPMACGYGICVGCAVPIRDTSPAGFSYRKVCTDGPIFWSHQLHWPSARETASVERGAHERTDEE